MKTDTSSSTPLVPFLTRLASPIPQQRMSGTRTATLVREETADEDTDYSVAVAVPYETLRERHGATYDDARGFWIKDGQPFVALQKAALGTETLTKIVEEEADEDR